VGLPVPFAKAFLDHGTQVIVADLAAGKYGTMGNEFPSHTETDSADIAPNCQSAVLRGLWLQEPRLHRESPSPPVSPQDSDTGAIVSGVLFDLASQPLPLRYPLRPRY
jgi:hypothetical protein